MKNLLVFIHLDDDYLYRWQVHNSSGLLIESNQNYFDENLAIANYNQLVGKLFKEDIKVLHRF